LFKLLIMLLIGLVIVALNGDIKKFACPPQQEGRTDLSKKITGRLFFYLNRMEIPGLQVAVIKDDKLSNMAIGTADYGRKQLLTDEHVFRLGGISKLYTATIIMKIMEQGQLTAEATIETWFPTLPHAGEITVRNLLNHTSGIYNYCDNPLFRLRSRLTPNRVWRSEEIYQYILSGKPYFPSGAGYHYSQSNYILLGLLAEKITGQSYEELINKWILAPLSLTSTMACANKSLSDRLVTGYERPFHPFGLRKHLPGHHAWASAGYAAGEGLVANATETARFLHRLFTYHILKKESLEKMLQFYLCRDPRCPEQNGYGLGISRLVLEGDTLWGHTCDIFGFSGAAFYCKEHNYYIALLGNVSRLDLSTLLSIIIQAIHEQENFGQKNENRSLASAV